MHTVARCALAALFAFGVKRRSAADAAQAEAQAEARSMQMRVLRGRLKLAGAAAPTPRVAIRCGCAAPRSGLAAFGFAQPNPAYQAAYRRPTLCV